MTTYDRILNQTEDNLDRATRRWAETQEQAVAMAEETTTRFRSVLPIATEAVDVNYRLFSEAFRLQKDLTIRWLKTLESTPATSGKSS
jgi:hypothetical protein